MRVVSLIASATEMVCALGCEDMLVGRSHECDFPPSVTRLPVLTAPKMRTDVSSAAIDAGVKDLLRLALAVYQVDADQLAALKPDVIVTQSQCDVCAVSLRDVEEAVCQMIESRPHIVSLEPNGLDDVFVDLARVGEALEVPDRATSLTLKLRERMEAIATRAPELPHPTVACLEWIDPLMSAGNWMPTLVEMAGGRNLFGVAGKHSPYLAWEDMVARDPEIIVALPCGFDLARTAVDMAFLAKRPEWPSLRAVREGRVFVTDGNQYFNRPGPRLAESLEILAEIIHPDVFRFGHREKAWRAWSA